MATATQLNLTLPSTMGTLARLCRVLADGGVNLLALATATEELHRAGIGIRYAYATAYAKA